MARTALQRAQQRDASRRYRERHPDRVRAASRAHQRRRRAVQPGLQQREDAAYIARHGKRAVNLARNQRLRIEDAKTLIAQMPAACGICGSAEATLVYDHDHTTNHHRGWLCRDCNLGLGMFRDSPELLRAASAYIKPGG